MSHSNHLRPRTLVHYAILSEDTPALIDAIANEMGHWFDTCQTIELVLERGAAPSERKMLAKFRELGQLYQKLVLFYHTVFEVQTKEFQGFERNATKNRIPLHVRNDWLMDLPDFLYGCDGPSYYIGVRVYIHFLTQPKPLF